MICPPCKEAGSTLQLARRLLKPDDALALAWAKHQACDDYDNCPCHHRVTIDPILEARP